MPAALFEKAHIVFTPDRRQSKTLILSTNADQKPLKTMFLNALATNDTKRLFLFKK